MTFNFKKMPDDATDFVSRRVVQEACARFYRGAADLLINRFLQRRAPSDRERQRLNFDKHHRLVQEIERQKGSKPVVVSVWRRTGGWSRNRYTGGCSTESEDARRRRQMAKVPTGRRARKRAKLENRECKI